MISRSPPALKIGDHVYVQKHHTYLSYGIERIAWDSVKGKTFEITRGPDVPWYHSESAEWAYGISGPMERCELLESMLIPARGPW